MTSVLWQCPRFDDRLRDHRARLVWTLLVFDFVTLVPAAALSTAMSPVPGLAAVVFGAVLVYHAVALTLLSRAHLEAAAALFVSGLVLAFSFVVVFLGGLHHPHAAGFLAVILLARVSLGRRQALAAALVAAAVCGGTALAELTGHLPTPLVELSLVDDVLTLQVLILFVTAFVQFAAGSLERAIDDEHRAAEQQARLAEQQAQLAAQANALARLGQAAVSATSAEGFAEEVVNAVAAAAGARVALVMQLGAGRARLLALTGATVDASFSQPETRALLERISAGRGTSILEEERVPGLPGCQLAAPIATTEGALGVLLGAFDDPETCARATAFIETAASLLATTFERERQRDRWLQEQKLDVAGRLAASVGHEFNNLLAGILGDASAIAEETTGGTRGLATGIVAAAQRGAMLTRRLLTVAKKQVARAEHTDASEEVHRFHGALTRWIPPTVQTELVLADVPLPVRLDRSEYEQLLHALSSNAVHAMPSGGTLSLRTRHQADDAGAAWAVVEVADTGVGINDGTKAHLFEPFFSTRSEGAGLGLFTVRTIVEKNGGQLRIDTEPGAGTTVQVLWPLARTERPVSVAPRSSPRVVSTPFPGSRAPERVLVVDDELFIRKSMVRILSRAGYEVLQADDGLAALEVLESGPPVALIVTDAVMPRLNGPELAARAKEAHGVPSILVSGYTDGLIGHAADLPFLAKPFMPDELVALVRQNVPRVARADLPREDAPVADERFTQGALHGLLPPEAAFVFAGIRGAAAWVYDHRRDEITAGPGYTELFGFERAPEWRGRISDLEAQVVEADRPALLQSSGVEIVATDRVRIRRSQPYRIAAPWAAETRWLAHVSVTPRGWPRTFGWTLDCTEEVLQREAKARVAETLGRLDHAQLSTMIAGQIAHDLNNYLTVVMNGATDLRARAQLDQELTEELADIEDAARRCVEMTRRLLRLSRSSTKQEPLALQDVVRDLARLLERLTRDRATLELQLEDEVPYVLGDRGAFERAVANLVINARDATPSAHGKITVRVERTDDGGARVAVEDRGTGMSPEVRAHLFEPFFSTKHSAGNGLGLATVKATVESMRGQIEVDSEPGRGTTFVLRFPATPIAPEVDSEPAQRTTHDIFADKTVLVADGDESVSAVLTASLAPHHTHTLAEATELGVQLAMARARAIDFVVLDTTLRDGSWPRVLASVRERSADVPVVVTTAGDPRSVAVEPSDRRTRVLGKPYTLTELATELDRARSGLRS